MGNCLGKNSNDQHTSAKGSSEPAPSRAAPPPQSNNGASHNNSNGTTVVASVAPPAAQSSIRDPDNVSTSTGSVEDKFELGKELGRGGFSVVREGINRSTGGKVAVKFIEKKFVDQEELKLLQREIDIMRRVEHKNVLRLFEIYDTPSHLSLVMELVNGGELFYKIVDKGSYSEREARDIVRQLVEGVDYLHSSGIAHRDLKPENLLCSETEEGVVIKIADFGLSKAFNDSSMLVTSCGTPDYAAPEVLRMDGAYDKSVDLWSIGVITYVLLCGFPPFYGKTQAHLFEKIMNADFDYPDPEWTNISDEAKDFITHLLVLDVGKRYTTKQCLDHPWLKGTHATALAGSINVTNTKYINEYTQKRKDR